MLVCPCLDRNGRIRTYRGFEIYQYVSEHKNPGRVLKYKAYLPRRQLVTKPHKKLLLVKKEIDHIINDHMVCEFLKKALPRTKNRGNRRCATIGG